MQPARTIWETSVLVEAFDFLSWDFRLTYAKKIELLLFLRGDGKQQERCHLFEVCESVDWRKPLSSPRASTTVLLATLSPAFT